MRRGARAAHLLQHERAAQAVRPLARPLLTTDGMHPTRVHECMSTPPLTESPEASLVALAAVLRLRQISAAPIVDGSGDLVGIVSTTDILRAPPSARAKDIMTAPVVTVSTDDPLDDAARRLVAARVHRVVALDARGRVAGVLSARDVLERVKDRKRAEPLSAIMTTPVETIDVGAPIEDAIHQLTSANVRGLVVVDSGSPVGVFTHTEALAARRLPPALRAGTVEDVMSYETICLDVATPIHRAAAYAVAMNVRRLLVVEHRRLVGIVSCLDLADVLARAPAS